MRKEYAIYRLRAKMDEMASLTDLNKFIEKEDSLDDVRAYYRINHWAYRRYHSQDGFMHFRVSKNGVMTDDDIYLQPDKVASFIKPGATVLELGIGQGSNLLYLAHSFPDVKFYGADLTPREDMEIPGNVMVFKQDYSSIPQLTDGSVDVAYAIETIFHNVDKVKIMKEVWRILKPGGVFVVYDCPINYPLDNYDEKIQLAIRLASKVGAAPVMETVDEWNSHFINSGFTTETVTDYTQAVLPDLKRLEHKAAKIMRHRFWAKLFFALLPKQFTGNVIAGYIMYDADVAGVGSYTEWILKKK